MLTQLKCGRRAAAAVLTTTLVLSGCSSWAVQTAPPRDVLWGTNYKVVQVRKTDGSKQTIQTPYIDGDMIIGFKPVGEPVEGAVLHQRQYRTRFDTLSIALSEVSAVALPRSSAVRTIVFIGAAAAGAAAVISQAGATGGGN